jgi:hypothetical protein
VLFFNHLGRPDGAAVDRLTHGHGSLCMVKSSRMDWAVTVGWANRWVFGFLFRHI